MKFDIGIIYKMLSSDREFRENRFRETCVLLEGINDSLMVFSVFMNILSCKSV